MSSILAPNGETIGHEVRPFYLPFTYDVNDVLDGVYRLKDVKVVINVDGKTISSSTGV